MNSVGTKPRIGERLACVSMREDALAIAFGLLVFICLGLLPWFSSATFAPKHRPNDVDFSALRNSIHLAARFDGRHLRDVNREDGKGAAPPERAPFVVSDFIDAFIIRACEHERGFIESGPVLSFYRGIQQPRAPPVYYF